MFTANEWLKHELRLWSEDKMLFKLIFLKICRISIAEYKRIDFNLTVSSI